MFGIRKTVRAGIKKALGIHQAPDDTSAPRWQSRPPAATPAPPPTPAPEPTPPTTEEPPSAASATSAEPRPLNLENLQEVLDEMIRPALQGDGGDISLIKLEEQDVYVRLVGACSTCPTSIMTMKMGVELLLKEEFPQINEIIQVD